MTTNPRPISELALATIDELDRRGWTRGTLARIYDDTGREAYTEEDCKVCLLGAMSSAYNPFHPTVPGYNDDAFNHDPEYQRFIDAVEEEIGKVDVGRTIPHWNDTRSRDVRSVKALLKRVAKKHAKLEALKRVELVAG